MVVVMEPGLRIIILTRPSREGGGFATYYNASEAKLGQRDAGPGSKYGERRRDALEI